MRCHGTTKRTITTLAVAPAIAVSLSFGLAACGGDEPAGAGTTTATEAASSRSAGAPGADLRVTLDRLLGEHAHLAVFAMQKGVSGDEDFEAIAGSLERNTQDLGEAIGSVYGPDAKDQFLEMWRDHIGFFVDYTVATAKDDQAGRQGALDELAGYRAEFSQFLAGANPNLSADGVSGLLQQHVDQLTTALDSYEAGRYEEAYAQVHAAHEHMFMTGDALAGAIVEQFPERFAD